MVTSLRKLLLWCLVGSSIAASAGNADPAVTLPEDIAPRPLTEALAAFGRQTGLQLIYVSTIAETQHSKGARAGLTASAALTQLLEGTGLAFEFLNARTVRIFPVPVTVPTTVRSVTTPQQLSPRSAFALEEVIVTATRREEAANRVPINMVVWTPDAMQASGVKGMSELAALTPALQFQPTNSTAAAATNYLVMRGVTDRYANTTGLYLDDTPIPPVWGSTLLL